MFSSILFVAGEKIKKRKRGGEYIQLGWKIYQHILFFVQSGGTISLQYKNYTGISLENVTISCDKIKFNIFKEGFLKFITKILGITYKYI